MGELSNFSAEHARIVAQRKAEFRQREAVEQSKIERERHIAHRRATEFVEIMKRHDVPRIPLVKEVWGQSFIGKILTPDRSSERLHRFDVISLGWIATSKLYMSENDYWVFVAENAAVSLCTEPKETKIGMAVQLHPYPHFPPDDYSPDRILAKDEMLPEISNIFIKHGIV